MKTIFATAAAATFLVCATASAHGPGRATRYRVEEVKPPASLFASCLAEFRNYAQGSTINDFGVVAGNLGCFSQVDPTTGQITTSGGPFVWASWFGGLALRDSDPATCCSFATKINNRGEVFGAEVPNFVGVKWSLAGGLETVFPNDDQCEIVKLDIAIAGNGRYAVGAGLRAHPDETIPGFCLTQAWLTRTPSGTVVQEMLFAQPQDINAFNMV